jgi:hypothetical protein
MLIPVFAGLSWGGQLYPWASAHTLSTLLVGLVLLAGFFVWGRFFWGKIAIGELTRFFERGTRRQRTFVATTISQELAVWWHSDGCRCCVRCFLSVECFLAAADFDPMGNRSPPDRLAVVHIRGRHPGWPGLRWFTNQSRESEVAVRRSDDDNDRVHRWYVRLSVCSCQLLTASKAWLLPIGTPCILPKSYASWVASPWATWRT